MHVLYSLSLALLASTYVLHADSTSDLYVAGRSSLSTFSICCFQSTFKLEMSPAMMCCPSSGVGSVIEASDLVDS